MSSQFNERIVVLDFGSQYSQLIARRIRECNVFCELLPHNVPLSRLKDLAPKGIIFSGGPASVYQANAPRPSEGVFDLGVPVLGICYGAQLLAEMNGGHVKPTGRREFGKAELRITTNHKIFSGVPVTSTVWMSHGDSIVELPKRFEVTAVSGDSVTASIAQGNSFVGLQFHPEVTHSEFGLKILRNFVIDICGCSGSWTPEIFIDESVAKIKREVGEANVICGLSGGVDSTVAAVLVSRAIGSRLKCLLVDNGLMRHGEAEECAARFRRSLDLDVEVLQAGDLFLTALKGVSDPERKRQIIGEVFIRVFEARARSIPNVKFLLQGTLYPDVIESAGKGVQYETIAANIKTHHNVGGLPEKMGFKILEPQRYLFKDEVRKVGKALSVPDEIVWRHPFPGPGLAVRIIGEVTPEKLETLRLVDKIFIDELRNAGLYYKVAQALAVLTPIKSVGVMGDSRTYANMVALRAVTTEDWMTADWARLPEDLLARVSTRIVNEVRDVNRVVYDITSKPPATVEWE